MASSFSREDAVNEVKLDNLRIVECDDQKSAEDEKLLYSNVNGELEKVSLISESKTNKLGNEIEESEKSQFNAKIVREGQINSEIEALGVENNVQEGIRSHKVSDDGSDSEEGGSGDLEMEEDDTDQLHSCLRKSSRKYPITDLPDTVTKLVTCEGSEVYVVGTAHFSLESQEDVAKVINATQPDVVVVELCKGRVNILSLDEETILQEAESMTLEKIHSTIKQNGFVYGIMYLFLLSMSAHLTKQLGMAPGGEFRRAFSEAKKVPGCIIHLGDRPIQVTLHRALAELSVWQKLCLAWCFITAKDPISKEEVERCKNRDLLEEMLAEMTGKFPAFSRVFVKERDIYLTHSLQLAASPIPCDYSETGFTPAVVVGVVGIGHVPGIVENWEKMCNKDILELLRVPESSLSNKIARYAVRASFWGLLAWGCYKIFSRPSFTNLFSKVLSYKWSK